MGTAYNTASRVWFTLSHGILNEVYFPTVDSPQVRDLGYLVTDGESFFHEEKRDLETRLEYLDDHALGYRVDQRRPREALSHRQGDHRRPAPALRPDPHAPGRRRGAPGEAAALRPARSASRGRGLGQQRAQGERRGQGHADRLPRRDPPGARGLDPASRAPPAGSSAPSDGWTDLRRDLRMDWEFDRALDGNVAVMGELDLSASRTFTLGLAFGFGRHAATTILLQSLGVPYEEQRERFRDQWHRACSASAPLQAASGDGGRLYQTSRSLLLAHEDKSYPGALIASLSIPWGEARGDEDGLGGYHLVWTRDMCNSATALLASGDARTPETSAHLPRGDAAAERRLLPELLDRWRALLARSAARRDRLPVDPGLAAPGARGRARLRSLPDGPERGPLPRRAESGHAAGAMGGVRRLLAFDTGGLHRGPRLRGAVRPAARGRRHGELPGGLRGLPRVARRGLDGDHARVAACRGSPSTTSASSRRTRTIPARWRIPTRGW